MKNILVPVDFSNHSVIALSHAIELSKNLGENIVVLNTYQEGVDFSTKEELYKEAKEKMDNLMNEMSIHSGDVKITPMILHGVAVDKITQTAKNRNCDLIVMGSKGASGLKEVFLGSVAGGVISESEIPVLIIPNKSERVGFYKIVFALGQDKINKKDVTPLLRFMKAFSSELELVHFGNEEGNSLEESDRLAFLEGVENYRMNYAYGKSDSDIENKIQKFAKEKDADLICMIRRNRTFWQRLFGKSATMKQAYHSGIPLLILQDK